MKSFYVLSIVAAGVVSTILGSTLVAAGTPANSAADTITVPALEQLKVQSASGLETWKRPL